MLSNLIKKEFAGYKWGAAHYWYSTSKGKVSLLFPSRITFNFFEIYNDNLEDIERFYTLQEAEERINEILC